jgi:hypothetical protein
MKFVIASSPFVGHLNPLLQIAGLLRGGGHEIIVHTATTLRDRAAGLDARFVPLRGDANFDARDMAGVFPEHDRLTPGVMPFRYIMEHVFIDRMADQYAGLREILRRTRVDGIIADYVFMGTMPLLLGAAPIAPPSSTTGSPASTWSGRTAPRPARASRRRSTRWGGLGAGRSAPSSTRPSPRRSIGT